MICTTVSEPMENAPACIEQQSCLMDTCAHTQGLVCPETETVRNDIAIDEFPKPSGRDAPDVGLIGSVARGAEMRRGRRISTNLCYMAWQHMSRPAGYFTDLCSNSTRCFWHNTIVVDHTKSRAAPLSSTLICALQVTDPTHIQAT